MGRGVRVAVLVGREPAHRYSLHHGYVDALWAVGATPFVLTPPPSADSLDRYVTMVTEADGVLVAGELAMAGPAAELRSDPEVGRVFLGGI